MKQFFTFVKKEFYHIIRDYRTLLILFGMPVVQVVLFGFALSNEVKNTRMGILDLSKDEMSIELSHEIKASRYFDLVENLNNYNEIDKSLRSGNTKLVVVIPPNFSEDLGHQNSTQVQIITDGNNPNLANQVVFYITNIVNDFQQRRFKIEALPMQVNVIPRMLYNPQLRGEYTFVPGVIALVLMLVCAMMTSVSIVKEKEMGNMEVLLVSPMNPLTLIFSKAIPYLVLSLLILTMVLFLCVNLLGVPIRGSLFLMYGISFLFLLTALSLGLLISTITNSQREAMMISMIGLLLPTMMLSGFMFPIESMPKPLQLASNLVPARWYFEGIQGIMVKGLNVAGVWKELLILSLFFVVFLGLSLKKFEVRLSS